MDQTAEHLFRRALEAAAKALRDLKANQIPADLRRVARRPLPLPPEEVGPVDARAEASWQRLQARLGDEVTVMSWVEGEELPFEGERSLKINPTAAAIVTSARRLVAIKIKPLTNPAIPIMIKNRTVGSQRLWAGIFIKRWRKETTKSSRGKTMGSISCKYSSMLS